MKIVNRRVLADKVLCEVKRLLRKVKRGGAFNIHSYQNCREQGHTLFVLPDKVGVMRWIAWSENRNSDAVVVYYDKMESPQGLTDVAWANRRYFSPEDKGYILSAARYIVSLCVE